MTMSVVQWFLSTATVKFPPEKEKKTNLLKIIVDVHNERSTIWGIDRKEYPNSSF